MTSHIGHHFTSNSRSLSSTVYISPLVDAPAHQDVLLLSLTAYIGLILSSASRIRSYLMILTCTTVSVLELSVSTLEASLKARSNQFVSCTVRLPCPFPMCDAHVWECALLFEWCVNVQRTKFFDALCLTRSGNTRHPPTHPCCVQRVHL